MRVKRCLFPFRFEEEVVGPNSHLIDDNRYQDLDCADIRAIPETYVHRSTDLVITAASERGVIRGYVVMPPLICKFFSTTQGYIA